MCSTQGSHSARAAGSAAKATTTTNQRRAGEIRPRSPSKHQPSWAGWCKGWENVTGEGLCCST